MNVTVGGVVESNSLNLTTPMESGGGSSGGLGVLHMRLILTFAHLLLVALGSVNLLVILVILLRPYMRSITNVYISSLCLADFVYLTNLSLVAATQLNNKSWPFGSLLCTLYHGTETTGKYASVMFVVLLAADRYCAMCQAQWCAKYRNYRTALCLSLLAWLISAAAASPLYAFSEVIMLRLPPLTPAIPQQPSVPQFCIARWPSSNVARWYIIFSSVFIFVVPLAVIVWCYYHILNKLKEALKRSKRMHRGSSHRTTYHKVTRLVLWVVVFHAVCWTPFWLFNLFSSIFRLRIQTQFDRVVVNIIHLFPYVNCSLNPLLYVAHAENFRIAFRSLFCPWRRSGEMEEDAAGNLVRRQAMGAEDSRMYPMGPGNSSPVGLMNGSVAISQIGSRSTTSPSGIHFQFPHLVGSSAQASPISSDHLLPVARNPSRSVTRRPVATGGSSKCRPPLLLDSQLQPLNGYRNRKVSSLSARSYSATVLRQDVDCIPTRDHNRTRSTPLEGLRSPPMGCKKETIMRGGGSAREDTSRTTNNTISSLVEEGEEENLDENDEQI